MKHNGTVRKLAAAALIGLLAAGAVTSSAVSASEISPEEQTEVPAETGSASDQSSEIQTGSQNAVGQTGSQVTEEQTGSQTGEGQSENEATEGRADSQAAEDQTGGEETEDKQAAGENSTSLNAGEYDLQEEQGAGDGEHTEQSLVRLNLPENDHISVIAVTLPEEAYQDFLSEGEQHEGRIAGSNEAESNEAVSITFYGGNSDAFSLAQITDYEEEADGSRVYTLEAGQETAVLVRADVGYRLTALNAETGGQAGVLQGFAGDEDLFVFKMTGEDLTLSAVCTQAETGKRVHSGIMLMASSTGDYTVTKRYDSSSGLWQYGEVNGVTAYCLQHENVPPAQGDTYSLKQKLTSTTGTITAPNGTSVDAQLIRKLFYYGYLGPGQKTTSIQATTHAMSIAYGYTSELDSTDVGYTFLNSVKNLADAPTGYDVYLIKPDVATSASSGKAYQILGFAEFNIPLVLNKTTYDKSIGNSTQTYDGTHTIGSMYGLENAQYVLYGTRTQNSDGTYSYSSVKGYFVTSASGAAFLRKTADTASDRVYITPPASGTAYYYLKEKTASAGHTLDARYYTVAVTKAGTVTITVANGAEVTTGDGYVHLRMKEYRKYPLKLVKACLNETCTSDLEGTEYALYSDSACTKLQAVARIGFMNDYFCADTSTASEPKLLSAGTYYMKETQNAEGHEKDVSVYTVSISRSGAYTISPYSGEGVGTPTMEMSDDGILSLMVYDNENEIVSGSITILKYGTDDKLLEGVAFSLQDADGNELENGVTDADGQLTFENLEPATYYLEETKTLPGYLLLAERIEVEIPQEVTENGQTTYLYNRTIKVYNSPQPELPQTGETHPWHRYVLLMSGLLLIFGGVLYMRKTSR